MCLDGIFCRRKLYYNGGARSTLSNITAPFREVDTERQPNCANIFSEYTVENRDSLRAGVKFKTEKSNSDRKRRAGFEEQSSGDVDLFFGVFEGRGTT